MITYRITRPNAGIVSHHHSLGRAIEALERQQRGARRQGGYSEDYIEELTDSGWRMRHEPPKNPIPAPGSGLGARRLG